MMMMKPARICAPVGVYRRFKVTEEPDAKVYGGDASMEKDPESSASIRLWISRGEASSAQSLLKTTD
jgi:hypothetical protein